jgi:hypothetical protein
MLQDYAVIIQGAAIRSSEFTENREALILRQSHIKNNGELVFSTDENYIEINEQNIRYLIQEGDIIMATTGPLNIIGNMFQYKLSMKAIVAGPLIIIRPNENPEGLYNRLKDKYYHIKTMVTLVGVLPRINIRQIRELEI